jgi:hypothetical protein
MPIYVFTFYAFFKLLGIDPYRFVLERVKINGLVCNMLPRSCNTTKKLSLQRWLPMAGYWNLLSMHEL